MTLKTVAAGFLLLVVLGVLFLVYEMGHTAGKREIRAEWDAERIEQARQRAELTRKTRLREMDLQMTIDRLRGEHHETVIRITAERDSVVRELRRRPERPADYVPPAAAVTGAEPAASCSADQLYREDATALVGLAADADTVRASLTECRAQYEAAQKAME